MQVKGYQSRVATYTSGRVPHVLFNTAGMVVLDVPTLQHAL